MTRHPLAVLAAALALAAPALLIGPSSAAAPSAYQVDAIHAPRVAGAVANYAACVRYTPRAMRACSSLRPVVAARAGEATRALRAARADACARRTTWVAWRLWAHREAVLVSRAVSRGVVLRRVETWSLADETATREKGRCVR